MLDVIESHPRVSFQEIILTNNPEVACKFGLAGAPDVPLAGRGRPQRGSQRFRRGHTPAGPGPRSPGRLGGTGPVGDPADRTLTCEGSDQVIMHSCESWLWSRITAAVIGRSLTVGWSAADIGGI